MHEAFRACLLNVAQETGRERLTATAAVAYGNRIAIGTTAGSLKVYNVDEAKLDGSNVQCNLELQVPKFGRKIEYLAVIKEIQTLVGLVDGVVNLYELQSARLVESLSRTKEARVMALVSSVEKDAMGVPTIISRLAVGLKRKLIIYSWHDAQVSEPQEFNLADRAKTITWISSNMACLGLSADYCIVDIDSAEVREPFSAGAAMENLGTLGSVGVGIGYIGVAGKAPSPLAIKLNDSEVLLSRDTITAFLNDKGESLDRRQMPWNAGPDALGYSYPFLLTAKAPETIQIWNVASRTLVQTLSIPQIISFCSTGRIIYALTPTQIWQIVPRDFSTQINALAESRQFTEAISILKQLDDVYFSNKPARLRDLHLLHGIVLFSEGEFEKAMTLFSDIAAAPGTVLALFPEDISGEQAQAPIIDSDNVLAREYSALLQSLPTLGIIDHTITFKYMQEANSVLR